MFSLRTKKVLSECDNVYEKYKQCIKTKTKIEVCDNRELDFYNCILNKITKTQEEKQK
jgi:hypothetical protein